MFGSLKIPTQISVKFSFDEFRGVAVSYSHGVRLTPGSRVFEGWMKSPSLKRIWMWDNCCAVLPLKPWLIAVMVYSSLTAHTHGVSAALLHLVTTPSGTGGLQKFESKRWRVKVLVTQLCPTLCDPMDCRPLGSSVHGILQARILEWVAITFSRGSSQLRNRTWVSCIAGRFFTVWATREAQEVRQGVYDQVWKWQTLFSILPHRPELSHTS